MIGRFFLCAAALALLAVPGRGQEPVEAERVELRVSASGPGPVVTVDRGAIDGLRAGDVVVFRPREGGLYRGRIVRVDPRTSTVALDDPAFVPELGTRGEVELPADRRPPPPEPAPSPPPEASGDGEPAAGAPPAEGGAQQHDGARWTNHDEEYRPGMPLLARVRAVRPEERAKLYTGRLTLSGDATVTSDDGRSDALLRVGSDLAVENPFGFGGTMQMDLELDRFRFDVPDDDDDDETVFRVERLSYNVGGTRFRRDRFEVGRFLQHKMPELGVLDGFEWTRRLPNGDFVGASLGAMPEPDLDYDTGDDLQIAGYYEWVADGATDLSIAGGVQKTWHDGKPDRDLLVGRLDYVPAKGWDARATTWIDLYDSGDGEKGSGPEVTQALLSVGRTWDSDGLTLTYRRLRFPYLLREEYVESLFEDLSNDRYDRIALQGWHETDGGARWRGSVGFWNDEDDTGGDADLGLDVPGAFLEDGTAGFAVFFTRGAYSVDGGVRLSYALDDEVGRWQIAYEVSDRHQDGFSHESDDLWEHSLRGARSIALANGWFVSLDGEARYYDDETALSATLFAQKLF